MNPNMNRESIEGRLKAYFDLSRTALAAALSEVRWSFECPAFLAAVLSEERPDATDEEAVMHWAIRRGRLWS